MARVMKSLEITDEDGLVPGTTYMVGPVKVWGDEKFQPTEARLFGMSNIGVESNWGKPSWTVQLRGPILTKTGKHHKTRDHSRTYGPGKTQRLHLPDGNHILSLFTADEIGQFIESMQEDAERFYRDTKAVQNDVAIHWDVQRNPVHIIDVQE